MTATVGQISELLERWADPRFAKEWDKVGLQVGSPGQAVRRVLVVRRVPP